MRSRRLPVDDRWVVVSQTCDIVAPLDKEPVVEAFACVIEPNQTTRASYRRSFRWFEIDRTTGLVASAIDRAAFDKRTLLRLQPTPWPDTPHRLQRFSMWLGRRASREAIPTPIVDTFVRPFQRVIDRLEKRQPEIYRAFNEAVREIRIRLPESETPPFCIEMVLLVENNLSREGADAIDQILQKLQAKLKSAEAQLGEVLKLTGDRMSVDLLDATSIVDLEAMTYAGDSVVGAEPSRL